jgi:hypothetical protein
MRKAILAGLLGLATIGGLVVANPASAAYKNDDTTCGGAALVPVPGSGTIYGPTVPGGDEVVCADGFGGTTAGLFEGGAVRVGATTTNSPQRVCAAGNSQPVPNPVGVYVIADGDQNNAPQGQGYIGVSNYETSSAHENCAQNNLGGGTNSGGAVSLDGQVDLPLPLLVCGNTSGTDFDTTGRDGCYLP